MSYHLGYLKFFKEPIFWMGIDMFFGIIVPNSISCFKSYDFEELQFTVNEWMWQLINYWWLQQKNTYSRII